MSDAWEEIQAIKSKRNSLREKLQKRKKERKDILEGDVSLSPARNEEDSTDTSLQVEEDAIKFNPDLELELLEKLCDASLVLPISSQSLMSTLNQEYTHMCLINLLHKFATQKLITINESKDSENLVEITFVEHIKLLGMVNEVSKGIKRKADTDTSDYEDDEEPKKLRETGDESDVMSLLSKPSIREKQVKQIGEEILDLLTKPTAKERSLAERFKSQSGNQVQEYCSHGTRAECLKVMDSPKICSKLHFRKIIQCHTDESLGDCSFLNTCFHMDSCKYVHYEVDGAKVKDIAEISDDRNKSLADKTKLYPPQWIQCDLRYLDMTVLGKFAVIMADPPWDIHMELPYGTMSDDEMRQLGIPQLQDEGLLFLWVTGRAMELGRECLKLWGYERVDELIWVKTNQLQRIIRTGRTGHWLNHGKEHCLVGMKGNPKDLNRGLDSDVIVAEVRATSHKPDEVYGIIERLSPGTRKIELFGRPHNVQPNWITLGNQVDGVRLVDPDLIQAFREKYPDGNCMAPPKSKDSVS